MRFGLPARQVFVRLACVLSLALVAFGHDPLVLPRTDTLAIAAHAFPDGSLPVICTTDTAGKGDHTQAHRNGCDACRISSSFFLIVRREPAPPFPIQSFIGRPVHTVVHRSPAGSRLERASFRPARKRKC